MLFRTPLLFSVVNFKRLGFVSSAAAPLVAITDAEVKAAYRRLALECHPDVSGVEDRAAAEVQFRLLSEAYAALRDGAARRKAAEEIEGRRVVEVKKAQRTVKRTTTAAVHGSTDSAAPSGTGPPSYEAYTAWAEGSDNVTEDDPVSAYTSSWVSSSPSSARRPRESTATAKDAPTGQRSPRGPSQRGFVRKDADDAFRDAFDGKTWQQVLFKLQYDARHGEKGSKSTPLKSPSLRDASAARATRHAGTFFESAQSAMPQPSSTTPRGGKIVPGRLYPVPATTQAQVPSDKFAEQIIGRASAPQAEFDAAEELHRRRRLQRERREYGYNDGHLYSYQRPY